MPRQSCGRKKLTIYLNEEERELVGRLKAAWSVKTDARAIRAAVRATVRRLTLPHQEVVLLNELFTWVGLLPFLSERDRAEFERFKRKWEQL